MEWLIPVGIFGSILYVLWLRGKKARPKFLAICEYWAYLPEAKLPSQDSIMHRMINDNPHNRRGVVWIGANEGILFSDVRLRIALATRDKNPSMFRPDLFDVGANPKSDTLQDLAESKAVARVRYVSEEPLKDRRHLTFLPHLVDAIRDLGKSRIIYDCVTEKFLSGEEFFDALQDDPMRMENHVQVLWRVEGEDFFAETRGLRKIGCKELRSDFTAYDQRHLVLTLIELAAQHIWDTGAVPSTLDLVAYESQFNLEFRIDRKLDEYRVMIRRRVLA